MLPWVVRDLKAARSSAARATTTSSPPPTASRSATPGTRSAASAAHVNTACKLLLFAYGFEKLDCKVVGLRTDNFNFRSQRAIEALGAKKDGVIRHHWPRRDGTIRDTVMYSVLRGRMARREAPSGIPAEAT